MLILLRNNRHWISLSLFPFLLNSAKLNQSNVEVYALLFVDLICNLHSIRRDKIKSNIIKGMFTSKSLIVVTNFKYTFH